MSPRIPDLLDDPLLGCDDLLAIQSNAINVYHSALLRLRLFYPGDKAKDLAERIADEAPETQLRTMEYVINEVLYEIRRAQQTFNPVFEELVLKNWTSKVLKQYGEDIALPFIIRLKAAREARIR